MVIQLICSSNKKISERKEGWLKKHAQEEGRRQQLPFLSGMKKAAAREWGWNNQINREKLVIANYL